MAVHSVLYFLAFLVLQASSASLQTENITVLEGESVVLNCTMDGSKDSFIEWTNPRWQVIYFNNIQGLRDRRYKLVQYSSAKLIVTLLNTTVEDDGMYTCLYYSHQIVTKQVYLTVLAPPSPPVLNITKHLLKGREEKVISCITTGSKPKPQITWLVNNQLELHGHTEYKPENKGTKFTTISILKIKAHDQESRVDCLVRHESLMDKILRVTYRFDNNYNSLGVTESYTETANEMNTTSMPELATDIESFQSVTQENSTENTPTANYDFLTSTEDSMLLTNESETESSLNSTSSTELLTTKAGQSTFQITEDPSTYKNNFHNSTEGTTESDAISETASSRNSTPSTELPITEIQQSTFQHKTDAFTLSNSNLHNSTENNTETNEGTIFNSTSAWSITNTSSMEQEKTISTVKCGNTQIMENNGKQEKQQMKQSSALLLILIAFLICALLIVFQLFVLKIRKEHLKWRKQKDDSDLTVESNRSNKSSNEEHVRPENNNREPTFGMHYTSQIHSEEQMKRYTNNISEDQINTLDKESTV
ncbi:cytotoxic and regulatory T-cell molecule-like isoform X1 [Heterodontus francisci]|uniref:cytotoxic and regulatory T-cell molecule-like isoform X1 n=1 Tax=Heterodontus francisci TaxID=7792 RepID=UPI00355B18A4